MLAATKRFLTSNWQLLLMVAAVFALWSQPIALPLRLLVVVFHEAAHALAAIATGGSVRELTVQLNEGGHAIFSGGNLFIVASAGYLGSLLIGLALLIASVRGKADRTVLGILGLSLVALTLLYVRELFAIAFCLGTGAAFFAIARYLDAIWSDVVLRIIGLTSLIYVPYDIFSDTLARPHLRSDAAIIAETVGGPTQFWGVLWILLSLAAILWAARLLISRPTHVWTRPGSGKE